MANSMRSALVSTKWLMELMSSKSGSGSNHRILDAAWHLPNTGRIAADEYKVQHIPGALFFDVDDCADKSSGLAHMIPSVEVFEDYVGNLGINNDTHVIVYDNNPQFPVFSAQRVWWTFRLFGHDKVSVLEGGLQKWISEKGPVTSDIIKVPKDTFRAKLLPSLVKSYDDIEKNIKDRAFQVVDARPSGRFEGTAPEPRPDIKPGCIVDTKNIPFFDALDVDKKCMKNPEELKKLFDKGGIDLEKPIIASCGSGMTACMLALAAYQCGNDQVSIYDGAWTEWFLKAPEHLKKNVPGN